MAFDYQSLENAGKEKVRTGKRPQIQYPGTETVDWYGFKRHNFVLDGCPGFIVEPPNPAPELPWSWCTQWAEAFVPRTPALKLLERGFHHVYFDVFSTYFSKAGIAKVEKFYAMLRGLGFHPKAALIGMSYGGLFSFRWAAEHPETVGAIYADAPLCRYDRPSGNHFLTPEQVDSLRECEARHAAALGCRPEDLEKHPLSPINNVKPIADAKIPILVIRSGQDQSCFPELNIDVFAERLRAAGGEIEIFDRSYYGHHPHGLDDPQPLVDFILEHYPAF